MEHSEFVERFRRNEAFYGVRHFYFASYLAWGREGLLGVLAATFLIHFFPVAYAAYRLWNRQHPSLDWPLLACLAFHVGTPGPSGLSILLFVITVVVVGSIVRLFAGDYTILGMLLPLFVWALSCAMRGVTLQEIGARLCDSSEVYGKFEERQALFFLDSKEDKAARE